MIIFESKLKEMRKIFMLAVLSVFIYGNGVGQVFYSGFETWSDVNTPTSWRGVATSAGTTDVSQYTTSTQEGTFAVKLVNQTTSHKRLSTTAVSVTDGEVYNVSYYARGTGEVRTGLYRGYTGSYAAYSSYAIINGTTWTKVTQTIICDTTSATAEFILSFRNTTSTNDDLQIDSFMVSIGSSSSKSIYEIQYTSDPSGNSPYLGSPVNTGGIVSAVKSGAYWIQNGTGPWSGIYVYDNVNTPALGDSVTFSAIVDEYYNLTELKSVSSFVVVSSGNPVQVTSIIVPDAALESYEGVLVSVEDVECISMPDTYLEWVVGDGLDTVKIGDLIYSYTPALGTSYDITGVMDYSFSERKLQPRMASDISLHNAIDEIMYPVVIYPNPAEDMVVISNSLKGIMTITDMTGRIVLQTAFDQSQKVLVDGFDSGYYNVIITGEDGEQASSKLLVK